MFVLVLVFLLWGSFLQVKIRNLKHEASCLFKQRFPHRNPPEHTLLSVYPEISSVQQQLWPLRVSRGVSVNCFSPPGCRRCRPRGGGSWDWWPPAETPPAASAWAPAPSPNLRTSPPGWTRRPADERSVKTAAAFHRGAPNLDLRGAGFYSVFMWM